MSKLIDQENWELAKWQNGVGYLSPKNNDCPPAIILFFETMEQGQRLFADLIEKIGIDDKSERLRVAIIEGTVPYQRNGYFVLIGENHEATSKIIENDENFESIRYIAVNQRFHRVYVEGESPHLNKFKEDFEKFKCYYIGPGIQIGDGKGETQFDFDTEHFILKRNILFRNYDEIDEFNDPESILKTEEVQKYKF